MKSYHLHSINPDFTNLDYLRQFFPKATFNENEIYDTKFNGFEIEWIESEFFIVNRHYLDLNVGHVTDSELFSGNFSDCVDFLLKEKGE